MSLHKEINSETSEESTRQTDPRKSDQIGH
jgi:hypothetical protein